MEKTKLYSRKIIFVMYLAGTIGILLGIYKFYSNEHEFEVVHIIPVVFAAVIMHLTLYSTIKKGNK